MPEGPLTSGNVVGALRRSRRDGGRFEPVVRRRRCPHPSHGSRRCESSSWAREATSAAGWCPPCSRRVTTSPRPSPMPRPPSRFWWSDQVDVVEMDVLDRPRCGPPPTGAEALYYLVHGLGGDDFATSDREGAYNAAHAAVRAGLERIVYLGGLIPDIADTDLSPHLRSRLEVEQVLTDSGVPTLALRAAMVIGSGSTSFEIMRQMSERMPVQVLPRWMDSQVEPVAVTDVRHRPRRRAHGARREPRLRHRQRRADGVCRVAAALRRPCRAAPGPGERAGPAHRAGVAARPGPDPGAGGDRAVAGREPAPRHGLRRTGLHGPADAPTVTCSRPSPRPSTAPWPCRTSRCRTGSATSSDR